ncbi:MAG: signal peptidase II [Gammaproteobacteria bacterium]|nr:signal peptidase II [Gammaproteobacteria bacterium]
MPVIFRYLITLFVIVADQITKLAADANLIVNRSVIEITSWFNITLHYNPGAAFSFLSDAGGWQRWFFTIISAGVSIVLCVWLYRLSRQEKLLTWSLALILGGAIGNLIDRVAYGHVIDFIQWHYKGSYFPTFNIADAAITMGALLLIISTLRGEQAASMQSETED